MLNNEDFLHFLAFNDNLSLFFSAKQDNCLIGNKFNLDISASAVLLQTIELFGNNESWAIDVKKIISP